MAGSGVPAFSLRVGSFRAGELTVTRFVGMEKLSQPYAFQIDFHPLGAQPLEGDTLLGAEALLMLSVPGGIPRLVHGKVRSMNELGLREGRWQYRIHVAPTLWWLTRVQRSRIFQDQTVPDILVKVLQEAGIDARLSLSGTYEPREYCTQYRETDFAFLSRLMEWEGMFYFFEHSEDGHTLVISDSTNVHTALPGGGVLPLRARDERSTDGEYLYALERVHRLRPGAVHLKDYDFEKPTLDVSGRAKSAEGESALEIYDYPGEYVAPGVGKKVAKVRMEEGVQASRTLDGESVAPSLTPGYLFEVADDGSNAGQYTVVEVMHTGMLPETAGGREAHGSLYRNRLRCMPSEVPFRPRRLTPAPAIPGVQTAMVVGPAGEEIHTDNHGRIKVQFHWDREGARDDKASCWVRVGQTWGGPGWGAVYLPRIGQEVLVRFLEGNPDRPLIAGTVYNGQNPTPYVLPEDKTKSTLKSASSLGSNGFNEFRIEDTAGAEEIFVHAQKDKKLLTENDKDQEVRSREVLEVTKDRARTVEGHQQLDVTRSDSSTVSGNQSLQVQGDRSTTISGSHSEAVVRNQSITVDKGFTSAVKRTATESVGAAKKLEIGGAYSVNVVLSATEAVGGLKSVDVAKDRFEYVKSDRHERVMQNSEAKVAGSFQTEVAGQVTLMVAKDWKDEVGSKTELGVKEASDWSTQTFELKADTFNLIVNGKLILKAEKSGNIKLSPNKFLVEGDEVTVKGSKVKKEAAGSMEDKSVSLSLEKLKEPELKTVEFCVKSKSGKPLPDLDFEVTLADGTVKKGKTDSGGNVKLEKVPAGQYSVAFPDPAAPKV
ncbi:type VI secretion system Vgr family protein [Hyalangium versicolor]|uniref:type VI secretion system Vgr family protein n=1 Tax=Hyalangium versicolor TaxID=2861190 RepID=UPI001CCCC2D5|nr:type VI secretion system tip protein TssI/VgrG [Hyalangium versicolor]